MTETTQKCVDPHLVVEPAALGVGEYNENIFIHRLQELARARDRAASACHFVSWAALLGRVDTHPRRRRMRRHAHSSAAIFPDRSRRSVPRSCSCSTRPIR